MAIQTLQRIYTDKICSPETVIGILELALPIFNQNSTKKLDNINYYKGEHPILNAKAGIRGENYNLKNRFNITKYAIDVKTAIQLNKPITYVINGSKDTAIYETYKNEVEIIANNIRNLCEHKVNIDVEQDILTCGVGYQYTLGKLKEAKGNVKKSYFILGRFEPENTDVVLSQEIGNPIALSINKAVINVDKNTQITRYTCFDDNYKYIIEQKENKLTIVSADLHTLPYNPIQVFESDKYMLSMLDQIRDSNDSVEIAINNLLNDVLIQINQLLAVYGNDIDDEVFKDVKEKGILLLNSDARAEYLNTSMQTTIDTFIDKMIGYTLMLACIPTISSSRAETGKAVETQNGHTIANFMANADEQSFIKPKKEQLDNVISILKTYGVINSDISSIDIDIQFDQNRLTDISQAVIILETAIRAGLDSYDALNVAKLLNDPNTASIGMQKALELKHTHEMELKWGKNYLKKPQETQLETDAINIESEVITGGVEE